LLEAALKKVTVERVERGNSPTRFEDERALRAEVGGSLRVCTHVRSR